MVKMGQTFHVGHLYISKGELLVLYFNSFTHMDNSTDGVPTPTTPLCEGVRSTGGVVGGVQVPLTDHHECQNGSNLACGALKHDQR